MPYSKLELITGKAHYHSMHPLGLARVFWQSENIAIDTETFRAFIWGPLGGTIACCYILLAFIARFPFRRKERWARNAIIAAFGSWVLLDSLVCIYYGVYFQIYIINAFSILQKGLSIFFTWKNFSGSTVHDKKLL